MLFPNLAAKIQDTFHRLRGKGKLTEKDLDQALREVRLALLEADVNFKVVKDFLGKVKERSQGHEVLKSITPGQQVVKIVHDEMTRLMGGGRSQLEVKETPGVVMLVGLQGSGKTTTAAKLARFLKKQHRPLLAAADIYRPAAVKQLQILGESLDIPVFSMGEAAPVDIARASMERARRDGCDIVILDTAGRLHIDEKMMQELADIKSAIHPEEILLVADAMTGQDAVNMAGSFHQRLGITGVILTKVDGDTRGGAALSIKAVTDTPIKFVGMGEKVEAFEPFHPDRFASRILGMGDVVSLVEKAQAAIDEDKAREMEKKLFSKQFSLEDFKEQLQQVKNLGPLDEILDMIPGGNRMTRALKNVKVDEKELVKIEAIINSMTPGERRSPEIIGSSRRKRIAAGSGTRIQDVNQLLKQFAQMRKMMKKFGDAGKGGKRGGIKFPF